MANMNDLMEALGEAIAVDARVTAWCVGEYERQHQVMENMDARNEPVAEDCPLVVLVPMEKAIGYRDKIHRIGISCIVYDDTIDTSFGGEVVRFTGGRNVDIMRAKVLAAAVAVMPGRMDLKEVVTEYNTIEQYPFVSANMVLEIEQLQVIGGTPRYE